MGTAGRAQLLCCPNVPKKGKQSRVKGWRGCPHCGGLFLLRANSPVWRGCRGGAHAMVGHQPWGTGTPDMGSAARQVLALLQGLGQSLPACLGTWRCSFPFLPIMKNVWKMDTKNKDVKATGKT